MPQHITFVDGLHRPHGLNKVWRYMGIDKFLDLITTGELFFCRMSRLTDKYEAKVPNILLRIKRAELEKKLNDRREIEEELAVYEYQTNPMGDLSFVNCWSVMKEESYALWKVYLDGSRAGVAIQSTVGSLRKAIECYDQPIGEIYMGSVSYSDNEFPKITHRVNLLMRKTSAYRYEQELRLIAINFPVPEGGTVLPGESKEGIRIKVDLQTLIRGIYVSPFAEAWLTKTLKEVVRAVNPELERRFVTSSILDE